MRSNWQYLLLAVVLGVFSWYQVSGKERVETWIQLPVEYKGVPEGLEVRHGMVNKIEVRVRGPKGPVRSLDVKNMAYTVDLSGLRAGQNTLMFDPRAIPIRRSVEVLEINPTRMDLVVESLDTRRVRVKPRLDVKIDPDLVLENQVVAPEEVALRGPETLLKSLQIVETRSVPVAVPGPGVWEEEVPLDLPEGVAASPVSVVVSLRFGLRQEEAWLKVPVQAPEGGGGMHASPDSVRIRVRGPAPLLRRKDFGKDMVALLDTAGTIGEGSREVGFTVDLPDGVRLVEARPEKVRVVRKESGPARAKSRLSR